MDLEYEYVPDFCTNCRMIGHHINFCKKWSNQLEHRQEKNHNVKKKKNMKVFMQTKDGRKEHERNKDVVDVEKEVIDVEAREVE